MSESEPALPVLHYEAYPRIITDLYQLDRIRYGGAIKNNMPQYYLDSNGNWFQGKFTKILWRTSWLRRMWFSDVIKVDMTFEKLSEPPISRLRLMRYLMDATTIINQEKDSGYPLYSKELPKLARAELKNSKTARELIQTLIKFNITMKPWK